MKRIRTTQRRRSSNNQKGIKGNLYFVGYILSFFAVLILIQAFRWQVLEADKFTYLAQQTTDKERQSSSRGVIYASDGTVLAIDQPAWGIYFDLSQLPEERELFFENKDRYIATVSGILGMEKYELSDKITENLSSYKIAGGVSTEKKRALEEADIFGDGLQGFGLYFEREEKRFYPDGTLASHVLGFIGKDTDGNDLGQYGIEGRFFSEITGQEGYTYEQKDTAGNVILTSEYEPITSRDGQDFTLTIVPGVQKKVEEVLKEGVQYHQAKSGTAIIMDPNTGAIIAMANYPDYNPNEYWKIGDPWIFKNKAVGDVYEFGSVQKPITVAIGLESGKIGDDYICNDSKGYIELYDAKIYTWDKRPDGMLTPAGMLRESNNPCIAQLALDTGFDYYYPKLKEFGMGSFIGIGLQEEATWYLTPYKYWTKLDLAVTAFGQSISATPLQIISSLSTIANEGNRMQPYIISEMKKDEEIIKIEQKILNSPISKQTADAVAEMMVGVVRAGEARVQFNTRVPEYDIAGKTGTAQIPRTDAVGYYDDKTNTTFVGFSPTEDAKMIMLLRLEEPSLDTYSASTAVPLWIDLFEAVADDLEIPRNN